MALRHDLHDLTGVYTLDAIDDPLERTRFEHHLRRCQQCASEVRGLSETATRLAFAASRLAPPELRGRVLAAVSRTRQLPPSVDHHRMRGRGGHVPQPRLAWVAAAACLIVAVVLGSLLVNARRELDKQRHQHQSTLALVMTAPDVRAVTKPVAHGGTATVVYSLDRHALIVTTHGLPKLPDGKVYQLWRIASPITSAGFLPAARNGHTRPFLIRKIVAADTFGVTVEPAGGKKQPTTKPILLVKLTPKPAKA